MHVNVLKHPALLVISVLALSVVSRTADGAEHYTETFSAGLPGWELQGTGKVAVSNDSVRISFNLQGTPMPETASVVIGQSASSGAFVGDYVVPRIEVVGFDFLAEKELPSTLKLEWRSGTNVYFRNLKHYVTTTGVWHKLVVSISDQSVDSWSGTKDRTAFPGALHDVSLVALRIARSGAATQAYRLDNVFVDGAPTPAAIAVVGDGKVSMEWSQLRPNISYRLQSVDSLDAAWSTDTEFSSDNWMAVALDTLPATNDVQFFRLIQEEVYAP